MSEVEQSYWNRIRPVGRHPHPPTPLPPSQKPELRQQLSGPQARRPPGVSFMALVALVLAVHEKCYACGLLATMCKRLRDQLRGLDETTRHLRAEIASRSGLFFPERAPGSGWSHEPGISLTAIAVMLAPGFATELVACLPA